MTTPPAPPNDPQPPTRPERADQLLTACRRFSWIVLLGIPAICLGGVAAALIGSIDLNPMWIASALILACVFLHGAYCVRRDEANLRAGLWERDG
jgi:hypothetical protein